MPTYVRVKQAVTGHELSLPAGHVEAAGDDAYKVLDKPAVDAAGAPLAPKFHTTVAKSAAAKSPATTTGHKAASEKE